ncbi:pyruvate formate lyase activating enzyme [Desulfobotulus alkaliphilus]|uniref:Pyruvate formate lyase activating enzyme n=1 Tax=Desulfobotulus alkaliphilus TaxID=622671 RepID=A0A562RVA7_9BACT|nr:glycyl-radical enzyme activating protein [Desulfobotulus alkaliphilus]TWI73005.1 pyruvate formate lyase activating enzyme [Desulfobotulus alkaliphilus]
MSSFEDRKVQGMIFNIQKYSVHDGPGIRTIVFTKGCPLRCSWCSNPESQEYGPELACNKGRCLGFDKCSYCLDVCPKGAIGADAENLVHVNRSLCGDCPHLCAEACPAQSLIVYGKMRSVEDVLSVVEQDAVFYTRSGGGLTLSGGEPLLQHDFAMALLREAKKRRVRTAIETCGMIPWETLHGASRLVNDMLFDLKHMNSGDHERHTGMGNARILDNFKRLAGLQNTPPILVRTPVIPDFNDNEEAIRAIAEFLRPFKEGVSYELLPYHRLGTQKYHFLDRIPSMGEVQLDKKRFSSLQDTAQSILGDRLVRTD